MDRKKEKQLTWLLSTPMLGFLIFLGFIPFVFPIMSKYEGIYLPVVKNIEVTEPTLTEDGLLVDIRFDKVRSCEFLGISWYDSFGDRAKIVFEDDGSLVPETRPALSNQNSGPWLLIGIDQLDGTLAITSHRCHPFWITYTRFYP